MNFVMQRVEYDCHKARAYVEFRGPDEDGGDAIATAIFSYRTTERLSKKQVHEEVVRKARYLLRRAIVGRVPCPTCQSHLIITILLFQSPVLGCRSPTASKGAS